MVLHLKVRKSRSPPGPQSPLPLLKDTSAHRMRRSAVWSIDRVPHLARDQAVELLVVEPLTLPFHPSLAGNRFGDGERDFAQLRHRGQQRSVRIARGG